MTAAIGTAELPLALTWIEDEAGPVPPAWKEKFKVAGTVVTVGPEVIVYVTGMDALRIARSRGSDDMIICLPA
jgi:hypothetical protein